MIRVFFLVLTYFLFLSVAGCQPDLSPGADVEHATQVTFDQFREITKDEKVFWFLGSKDDFHYFRCQKGFYRISTDFEILDQKRYEAAKRTGIGVVASHVSIRGDKIGVPPAGVNRELPYPPYD